MESHKELQEKKSNEILTSVKNTFSLWIEEMKKSLVGTISAESSMWSDMTKSKQNYKKGQHTAELAAREDAEILKHAA